MKILLTGGNGFIGTNLFKKLIKEHDVLIYDKKNGNDLLIPSMLEDVISKFNPEIVIHLAAQSLLRYSINEPIEDSINNIIGSINLLNMCKKYNIKKIIYSSTGGARYGEVNGLVKEDYPIKPISPYGISKHTVEHYLEFYKNEYGLQYSILCFGNVYGLNDDVKNERIITKAIYCNRNNLTLKIYGDGKNRRDYLYIDDLVDFIVDNLSNNKIYNDIFNLGTGKTYSVLDIIDCIDKISGNKTKIEFINSIKSEVKNIGLNVDKIRNKIGWEAKIDLDEGIQKIFNSLVK